MILTPRNLDYLCVDIDSRNFYVLAEIVKCVYRPRVVQVEYNSHVPFHLALSFPIPKKQHRDVERRNAILRRIVASILNLG